MFEIIITLDYELPASGQADVRQHMIEPTSTLLEICEAYGAKLTIMVEIGELWAFEKIENLGFTEHLGYDVAAEIRHQLVDAVQRGHDVQLHLHPQWLGAEWLDGRWKLDYSKYRLPSLDYDEIMRVLRQGKNYLEGLLRSHRNDYVCIGFRAGNWNTQPPSNYLRAMHEAGLESDTSVFKWAYVDTASVYLDYRKAHSNVLPWYASWEDINRPSKEKSVLEVPIYAEPVNILGLLGLKRLQRARKYLLEDKAIVRAVRASNSASPRPGRSFWQKTWKLFRVYPKKLDFCKLTPREMLRMVEKIRWRFTLNPAPFAVPIVMIGHSKEAGSCEGVRTFLDQVRKSFGDSLRFATYREIIREYGRDADKVLHQSLGNGKRRRN